MAQTTVGPNEPYQTLDAALAHERADDKLFINVAPDHVTGWFRPDRSVIVECADRSKRFSIRPLPGEAGGRGIRLQRNTEHLYVSDFRIDGAEVGLDFMRGGFSARYTMFANFIVENCTGQGMLATDRTFTGPIVLRNGIFRFNGAKWPAFNDQNRNVYAERPIDAADVVLAFGASDEQFRAGGWFKNVAVLGNNLNIGEVLGNKDPIEGGVDIELNQVRVIYPRQGRGITIGNARKLRWSGPIMLLHPNKVEPTLKQSRAWRLRGANTSGGGVGVLSFDHRENTCFIDNDWDHQCVGYGGVSSDIVTAIAERTVYFGMNTYPARDYVHVLLERGDANYMLGQLPAFPASVTPEPDAPADVPAPEPEPPQAPVTQAELRTMIDQLRASESFNKQTFKELGASINSLDAFRNNLNTRMDVMRIAMSANDAQVLAMYSAGMNAKGGE